MEASQSKKQWSDMKHEPAKRTEVQNLIRAMLENELKIPTDPPIPLVNLGLGEPNKANGFDIPDTIKNAIIEVVEKGTCNGYTMSSGSLEARKAIVEKFSHPDYPFTEKQVILSFGCSGSLYNAVAVLCERGDNILAPRPGFPLCLPICQNLDVNLKFYDLLPEKGWEVDIESLKKQIDSKTKAILFNNPSNPCGSCFTKEHQLELIQVANEYKVPIIADEVYYGLAYDDKTEFHSFGNLTKEVPVICTGAISKIYCLPGWRLGWTIIYNNNGYFDNIIENIHKHNMIQLHPCSLVQAALPKILKEVGDDYFTKMKLQLKNSADFAFARLQGIRGITPIQSKAAMYMMVQINIEEFEDIVDDIDFAKKLLNEQYCLIFPSHCFFAKNFFRIIICTTTRNIDEFATRLTKFCASHYKQK